MLNHIKCFLEKIINFFFNISAITVVILICNIFYNATTRHIFSSNNIALQELEWHLFSFIILIGISYNLKQDRHVRVDLLYNKLSNKRKSIINILGSIFFILPFSIFIIEGSWHFVQSSYSLNEISPDPGGLPFRWIVKSLIPLSFILLILSSIIFIINNIILYKKKI